MMTERELSTEIATIERKLEAHRLRPPVPGASDLIQRAWRTRGDALTAQRNALRLELAHTEALAGGAS